MVAILCIFVCIGGCTDNHSDDSPTLLTQSDEIKDTEKTTEKEQSQPEINNLQNYYQMWCDGEITADAFMSKPGVMDSLLKAFRQLQDTVYIMRISLGHTMRMTTDIHFKFMITDEDGIESKGIETIIISYRDGAEEDVQYALEVDPNVQHSVKAFLLCSPHNPVGRVWTRDELAEIGRICCKYNVIIISDEIHSDFVYGNQNHIPISTLSEEIAARTVTCTAPSKTYNLAGLQASNIIVENTDIRRKLHRALRATGYEELNTMAIAATKAVYKDGENWLDALLSYLQENIRILGKACTETGGRISLIQPEGTYLMWLDCRRFGLSDIELADFFLKQAKVRIHSGTTFGADGSGFVRMNIACPKAVLLKAITQIDNAIRNYEIKGERYET